MYAEYLRERENKELLQDERGFAIYGYNCIPGVDFPHCYLQDVYVRPEWRRRGHASKLADQVAAQAKAAGFKVLISSVDCAARGAHESLQVLIAYGMQLFTAHDGTIFFSKEL
jgi:ribosomal protein S18 acetylase RimI-like enzyme